MKWFILMVILPFLACREQNSKSESKDFDPDGTIYDFGIVKESDTLRTTFVLKNQLGSELIIKKTFKGRNSMRIVVKDSILNPNETTEVDIVFPTQNLKGKQKVPIRLQTNHKVQEYFNYYITAEITIPKALVRSDFFDLILERKNISDSLSKKRFDFSKRFTKKEIATLNLDTAQIGLNEYYSLTEEKFLKKQIDSISFVIYYRHKYGDQLEKILRVKRKDTIFDLTLSMTGGDGQDTYSATSEFINDSIFKLTNISETTVADNIDLMAYHIESIVTKYLYDRKLDFKEFSKDTFNIRREITINQFTNEREVHEETIRKLGAINKIEMFYGFHNFSSSYTDRISLYKKKGDGLVKLMSFDSGGSLLQESKLVWLNEQPFVYFSFSETSGSSYGNLYSINKNEITVKQVKIDHGESKVPDSLNVQQGFGPLMDVNNKFSSALYLVAQNTGNPYKLSREYELRRIDENNYVLKAYKIKITIGHE